MSTLRLRLRLRALVLSSVVAAAAALGAFACSDDEGGAGGATTGPDAAASDGSTTTGDGGTTVPPPKRETWVVIGEAVEDGSIKSVARDATHLFLSIKPAGVAKSRLEKRKLADGALDATFGAGGVVDLDVNSFITVDDAAVYVVSLDYKLRKLDKATGAQIWENLTQSGSSPAGRGVAVDGTGIYVAGATFGGGFGGWNLQKFGGDGGAAAGFSPSVPSVFGGTSPRAMTVTSAGLFVGGDIANSSSAPTNYAWRVQAMNAQTGSTLWSKEQDPTQYSDILRDLAVSATNVYALVRDYGAAAKINAYGAADGTALAGFAPGTLALDPYRIAVDGANLYLAGPAGIERRDATTGAAVAFPSGDGGVAGWGAFPSLASVDELLVDDATLITVGTTRLDPGDAGSPLVLYVERRSKVTGEL